ncbi:MAG: GcrA cell cycle regulator [Rhodospirillaceae bacterium]|jgi:GcrA cell cycle regulator|nr:GcrA cell cycle regulator [Rhodospirillaceae bacterium]
MEWTNERIEELRRLWTQGQTASRIAELLGGITRNAVIGKAHRLGLRGRPSPIRRDEILGRTPRSTPAPRLAPAPAAALAITPLASLPAEEPARPAPMPAAPVAQPKVAARGRTCSWPVGDPKQPGFHFCGEEAIPGRPYCGSHCAVAYQRKTEAAA